MAWQADMTRQGPGAFRVVVRQVAGGYDAEVACAGFALVQRATENEARASMDTAGLSLGDIAKAAKKLAKQGAIARALRAASRLASNPIFQSIMPPQVAIALRATMAARRLMLRARDGDARARARLDSARASSPTAQRAIRTAARLFDNC
jgi:hypothetical protein